MKPFDSPWYPPRAGKFRPWLAGWYRFRRALREWIAPTAVEPSGPRLVLWLAVPGTFLLARGWRIRGRVLMAVWLSLVAICVIWIGTATSSSALVLASVIHTFSAIAIFAARLTYLPGATRAWRASFYGFFLSLALYTLIPALIIRRIVLPIESRGVPILINTAAAVSDLQRGDWIAYRFGPGVSGTGFDRILALPGETIRFYDDAFEVGGTACQRVSDRMPAGGEFTVPESHYYVWPAAARYVGAGVGEGQAELLGRVAVVPADRVIGPPFQRWLWRKQKLEPLAVLHDWTPPRDSL